MRGPLFFLLKHHNSCTIFKAMAKRNHLILIAVLFILVILLNALAFQFNWYWRLWWFDLLMHFLGGLTVAFTVFYITQTAYKNYFSRLVKHKADLFSLAIISAFLVGGAWELFEFGLDQYQTSIVALKSIATLQIGLTDSFFDLLFDLIGASVAALIFSKKYYEKRN